MNEESTAAHNADTQVIDNTTAPDTRPQSIKTLHSCVNIKNVSFMDIFRQNIFQVNESNIPSFQIGPQCCIPNMFHSTLKSTKYGFQCSTYKLHVDLLRIVELFPY